MSRKPYVVIENENCRITDMKDGSTVVLDKQTNKEIRVKNSELLRLLREVQAEEIVTSYAHNRG